MAVFRLTGLSKLVPSFALRDMKSKAMAPPIVCKSESRAAITQLQEKENEVNVSSL